MKGSTNLWKIMAQYCCLQKLVHIVWKGACWYLEEACLDFMLAVFSRRRGSRWLSDIISRLYQDLHHMFQDVSNKVFLSDPMESRRQQVRRFCWNYCRKKRNTVKISPFWNMAFRLCLPTRRSCLVGLVLLETKWRSDNMMSCLRWFSIFFFFNFSIFFSIF